MGIKGEISGRYQWATACCGAVEFRTNGPQGGDSGYGGFLEVKFINYASTDMKCKTTLYHPLDQVADTITLTFSGDCEIEAAIECVEFLAAKLKAVRKLYNDPQRALAPGEYPEHPEYRA